MFSKLAQQSRENLLELYRRMTPEERLAAFARHSALATRLYLAGRQDRGRGAQKVLKRRRSRT